MKKIFTFAIIAAFLALVTPTFAAADGASGDHYGMNPCTFCESVNIIPGYFTWCHLFDEFFKCRATCHVLDKCG